MCQGVVARLLNRSGHGQVRKVASLLAEPLSRRPLSREWLFHLLKQLHEVSFAFVFGAQELDVLLEFRLAV
jgi:hypothetical protein